MTSIKLTTINPQISLLGADLFLMLFGRGFFEGRAYLRDNCHKNSSLSKLLFSIILQEKSKFKY